ncbi:MAG TPA: arylsulfotransferase family protein [Gemmataceae bacterium]
MRRAFGGGVTWYEHKQPSLPPSEQVALTVGRIDKPDKTCDGFTLLMYGGNSRAVLVNMHGEVVHQWHVPFSNVWAAPPHLRGPINEASVYFNDGHLYPNGDLLVVVEGPINLRNPSNGYGLVKLDKDSRVQWKYAAYCHHDVAVAEDGTIYAIVNEVADKAPPGLEYIPTPYVVDVVEVISPEGKRLKRLPLLEALKDSPYAPLFGVLEGPKVADGSMPPGARNSNFREDASRRDVLHTNAVKVLSHAQASRFPLFKAGQLLISVRHLNALVVLDPASGKVVWATQGPWRAQHDPSFLDNGHLLLFDNLGTARGSRVLEFDPSTQAFPWSYPGANGKPFLSRIRGMCQRLPNDNTLIVNSDGGEVFEVTRDQEVVWSCSCGRVELNRARRYVPEQLSFLKGDQRARH